jgi:hypothetical protein
MDDIRRLAAIEEIKILKARYCRYVDTQDWAAFRTLFADDATLFFPENYDSVATIDDFMQGVGPALEGGVTVHHAVMPEIEIVDADNACGIWAMQDALYFPPGTRGLAGSSEIHGAGHYHETYVRRGGVWLFASIRLSRLRLAVQAQPRSVA